jgi:hypothetical protein
VRPRARERRARRAAGRGCDGRRPGPARPGAETLLYSNQALSPEDWKALSAAFLALHNEIVFADGSANARDVTARLFFLSARADAMTTSSRADAELESLRANWQKLGGEAFIPTTWMRAQAAGAR